MTSATLPPAQLDIISFGAFRIDVRGGRLLQAGNAVPLRPKTWSVLLYLVERPGVLVGREELLDAVWPDVAVTPDTLTKSIGELRHALGDDTKTPRYIETAHRRGFRFIAPVSGARAAEPETASAGPASSSYFVGRLPETEHSPHAARGIARCAMSGQSANEVKRVSLSISFAIEGLCWSDTRKSPR